jgi:two-component system phosphate regulon sensor histidine kinase PhoR
MMFRRYGTKRSLLFYYTVYVVFTLLSLVGLTWYSTHSFRVFFVHQLEQELNDSALRLVELHKGDDPSDHGHSDHLICNEVGNRSRLEISLFTADGQLICRTQDVVGAPDGYGLENPSLARTRDAHLTKELNSPTVGISVLAISMPVEVDPGIQAIIRLVYPLTRIESGYSRLLWRMVLGGIAVTLIVALLSFRFFRRIDPPLKEMRREAEMLARGEFSSRLPGYRIREIDDLALSMNDMAAELDRIVRALMDQRNKHEAIFSTMIDGVVVLDEKSRVSNFNAAAAQYFEISVDQALGRRLDDIVQNDFLRELLTEAVRERETIDTEVSILGGSCQLQVRSTPLHSADGASFGTLIVLNDITRLRRLEKVRRDFVANVSHELKTPVTSIKGFVETLLDGDSTDRENTERFLKIVVTHADRLTSIIEDLLTLARLESEGVEELLIIQEERLFELLDSVSLMCAPRAEEKSISIEVNCAPDITIAADRSLLQQAVMNLVDNAVKYSDPRNSVKIVGCREAGEIAIHVIDNGFGIDDEHLPRLFERFYRVDKARSRKMGGTGLGLAIVKHVISVHRGSISVKSKPGAGSTFSIYLPHADDDWRPTPAVDD